MLLPTSSRLHKGVVLVPQLAHDSAPTAALPFFAVAVGPTLASLSFAAGDAAPSAFGEARAEADSGTSSMSILADTASALLYVGHPEQADVPPVPSQRPSPGQVPPVV